RIGSPAGSASSASSAAVGVEGRRGGLDLESDIGHMTFNDILNKSRDMLASQARNVGQALLHHGMQRPGVAAALLLGGGLPMGVGGGIAGNVALRAQVDQRQAQIETTRADAQREINALAARLGELQAEANRLNALGERLTRIGQLQDGEFDFNK